MNEDVAPFLYNSDLHYKTDVLAIQYRQKNPKFQYNSIEVWDFYIYHS